MPQFTKRNVRRGVFIALLVLFVIALFFANDQLNAFYRGIKGVLAPFFTGAVIAFVFNVPVRALEKNMKFIKKKDLRRVISITITMLIVLVVIVLVLYLLVNQIVKELTVLLENEQVNIPELKAFVAKLANIDDLTLVDLGNKILDELGTGIESALSGAFAMIGNIAKALINLVLGIVFAIYCLFQKETLVRQGKKVLYAFLTEERADYIVRFVKLTNATFRNFLTGQCVEVCILGTLFAVTMLIFRMPYWLLISTVIAVTAFVPIVGAWGGCAFGVVLMFLDSNPNANPMMNALLFVVISIVIQQFENNVIYPKVVGTSIGLSGMWVLVAVAVGGALMGPAGMILMIPVASVLQTLIREETYKRLDAKNISQDKVPRTPEDAEIKIPVKKRKKKKEQ